MLDFNNIKIVCFDFDGVLCNWKVMNRWECPADRKNCAKLNMNYYDSLGEDKKPWFAKFDSMQTFINNYCKNIPCFLISKCKDYVQQMQIDWIERNYLFNIENRCVESNKTKIPMLLSIANEFNCKRSEILIIDMNIHDVLIPARNAGFIAVTPLDVIQLLLNDNVLKEVTE